MAKISTYPSNTDINANDLLIGTDSEDSNATKNHSIGSIDTYIKTNLGLGVTQVLTGSSISNQEPSGLDAALQVEFGAAQGSGVDPVQLSVVGAITFNQKGLYLFNGFGNFERQGASGGDTVTAFRALINGAQVGYTKIVELDKVGIAIPYETTIPLSVSVGDVLTWEIIRDSSGIDAGGLYTHTLLSSWSNIPSASFTVWRVGV